MLIHTTQFLLPKKNIPFNQYATIACDQYTSDETYWQEVEKQVHALSTLSFTLPEIYLKAPDLANRIENIKSRMQKAKQDKELELTKAGYIYIERQTHAGLRKGLLVTIDLENYDFSKDSKSLIRASEGTIIDRIPPRLAIRKGACMEFPHIMVLIDDPKNEIIEELGNQKNDFEILYDFELMKDGGHISGYGIFNESKIAKINAAFEKLQIEKAQEQNTKNPLVFAVGDGNHSLATAKTHWEEVKKSNPNSPARFALIELVNIHSPGIGFEPIHRAIFSDKAESDFTYYLSHPCIQKSEKISFDDLKKLLELPENAKNCFGLQFGQDLYYLSIDQKLGSLSQAIIDGIFQEIHAKNSKTEIDFIHGDQDLLALVRKNAIGLFTGVISRKDLLPYVAQKGPLPKKAFSMGDADDKRFYLEGRFIE